jgi:hypothetical protein
MLQLFFVFPRRIVTVMALNDNATEQLAGENERHFQEFTKIEGSPLAQQNCLFA